MKIQKTVVRSFVIPNVIIGLIMCSLISCNSKMKNVRDESKLIASNDSRIHYAGRIDFSYPDQVRFSGAGAYIETGFCGTYLKMEMSEGSGKNYIQVVIDDNEPIRIQLKKGRNTYLLAENLNAGNHKVLICKDTEAAMGYLQFFGFFCKDLVELNDLPDRKIECYGNSITVGAKMLEGEPCDQTNNNTNWNAANSAYNSYGALTARMLDASWQLTAWSGIGMVHSCCDMTVTMPDVYDRLYLEKDTLKWDFSKYIPDVVTICLGQNDGAEVVLSDIYREKYKFFVESLRSKYPEASIFCLTSPMADEKLFSAMNKVLQEIVVKFNSNGDIKIYKVELPHGMCGGCVNQGHPGKSEHEKIAHVLAKEIKQKMKW